MKNVATIMRRELAAYFTSPIGYIFIIVYVVISVGLFITPFFTFPVADMRPYFGNLPIMLCIFIPAVTMRVWAEERKENTWEMLLTFPMKAWELVIGKFCACLVFLAATLAATFTIPAMLYSLGNPDTGAIISGYFGTFLLGAFFLAIGILFSGFFKDQILAFVVSLLVCFGLYLVGTPFIAAYLDGMRPGFGSFLGTIVGLTDHYNAFTRGVVEVADIVYFVAWTALFLFLNIVYLDGRGRQTAKLMFGATVLLCAGIGLLGNWLIADTSLGRFDVTEDKIYTISPATERILKAVDTPVIVKVYITPKDEMPTQMAGLEQDILDKLQEMKIASGGNLEFQPVYLRVANVISSQQAAFGEEEEEGETVEKKLEERMLEKGIEPFSVQALSQDQMTTKLVYSSVGVAYKDKNEEIITPIMPQSMPDFEYQLVNKIYKLTREEKPKVALVAPKEAVNIPPEMRRIYEQMGQKIPEQDDPYEALEQILDYEDYEVERVELTHTSPLPEDYDTLVIVNPRSFSERQRWEINRAIASGKSVMLAVQEYEWSYQPTQRGLSINPRPENPGVDPLLNEYGLNVEDDILMDVNVIPLNIQSGGGGLMGMLGGSQPVDLPMQMHVLNNTMNQNTSITNRLSAIFYLWGTALSMDEAKLSELGLEAQTLISTTDRAWTGPQELATTQEFFEEPSGSREPLPLMAMITGQFPDAFAGQERPSWPAPPPAQPGQPPQPPPAEDGEAPELVPAPGKLLLLGSSQMFRRNFVMQESNLDLFMNSVDVLTLGDDLVNVRGRKPIDRVIEKPSDETRAFWKFLNYTLASAVVAIIGIVVAVVRRTSRNQYTLAHAADAE